MICISNPVSSRQNLMFPRTRRLYWPLNKAEKVVRSDTHEIKIIIHKRGRADHYSTFFLLDGFVNTCFMPPACCA